MTTKEHSIVEFYPDLSFSKCGYCQNPNSSQTFGMHLYQLTPDNMIALTNRNWRRSGTYGYHPEMDKTCCPQYMIRCDTLNFRMNKEQRQVLRKMNRFLRSGDTRAALSTEERLSAGEPAIQSEVGAVSSSQTSRKNDVKPGDGADPYKPKCMTSKERKRLKKLERMKIQTSAPPPSSRSHSSNDAFNHEKPLMSLLEEMDNPKNVHKLELVMIRSDTLKGELFDAEHEVYKRYQTQIHGDSPSQVTDEQFRRFLVSSPILYENQNGVVMGSYHVQYKLDGRIIAVEVMDILPECASSVYLFYDPEFSYLSLGKYSALMSVQKVRELNKLSPKLKYYLMGFYIHDCTKMKYKGDYDKSYLLCPETYEWVPIEICRPKLDRNKYSRLTNDSEKVDADRPLGGALKIAVDDCLCLYNKNIVPYKYLINPSAPGISPQVRQALMLVDPDREDGEDIGNYVSLVGSKVSKSILLYFRY